MAQDERQNAGRVNGQIRPRNALKRIFGTLHKAWFRQIAQMQHERHASEEKQRRKNQPEALFYKRHLYPEKIIYFFTNWRNNPKNRSIRDRRKAKPFIPCRVDEGTEETSLKQIETGKDRMTRSNQQISKAGDIKALCQTLKKSA